jgi:asparagine synthase (glutamine-hydrolysing)
MCGIVGLFSLNKKNENIEKLRKALYLIQHRGPDASGEWWNTDETVVLGHRRLSILELSNLGNQPMILDNRYVITFNGEIYNHSKLRSELIKLGAYFNSTSDTEVLLNAYKFWGENCLMKLEGMFAFIIFDKHYNTAFIARDRAGEKPLYYFNNNQEFLLSSELLSILELSNKREINKCHFVEFLYSGFVSNGNTLINKIYKLNPGHYINLNVNDLSFQTIKYWEPSHYDFNQSYSDNQLVEQLENLLNQSISLQGKADVNVGILLSGGLDSSLVTSIATNHFNHISTFTVSFPGNGKFDEAVYADSISKYFGTKHTMLNSSEITPSFFRSIAEKFDDPIMDTSILPMYLISNLIAKHCKVAIGGDGADELFGGYTHYKNILKHKSILYPIPLYILKIIAESASRLMPNGSKARSWLSVSDNNYNDFFPYIATYFNNYDQKKLLFNNDSYLLNSDKIINNKLINNDLVYSTTRYDFENYLLEDILVKVDRSSMLNSLEIRAPFLDHKIIDFAFKNVPSRLKVNKNDRKIILKLLAKKILPPNYNSSRKQGFSIPIENWLKDKTWLDFIKEVLLDQSQTTFNQTYIEKILKAPINQKKGENIFGLVMFEIWRNNNKIIFN